MNAQLRELIEAARDVERRAGPDREPRLRAAIAALAAPKEAGDAGEVAFWRDVYERTSYSMFRARGEDSIRARECARADVESRQRECDAMQRLANPPGDQRQEGENPNALALDRIKKLLPEQADRAAVEQAASDLRVLWRERQRQPASPPPEAAAAVGYQPPPVPQDVMEARAQGRSEALAIILGLEAETGLDDYIGTGSAGPSGEPPIFWIEDKLRELLRCDDSAWSLMQEAEGEYWHNLGLRESAQEMHLAALSPTGPQPAGGGVDAWPSGVLNKADTLETLTRHNAWRRGAKTNQTDPRMLGLALDAAIAAIKGGSHAG